MKTNQTKQIQVGIIGSMIDIKQSRQTVLLCREVGFLLAKHGAILMFGYEGDCNSLSQIAAIEASNQGGKVVAFLWGKGQGFDLNLPNCTRISTGQIRGGGRELALVLSCDAIISFSGGSGTLTEICFAYQANIPVIAFKNTSGWSKKLANKYLDTRRHRRIIGVTSPKEAVKTALKHARKSHKIFGTIKESYEKQF